MFAVVGRRIGGSDARGITSLVQQSTDRAKTGTRPAKVQSKDRDMGAALRSIYEKTVDETVPAEMLDLLGKLD
ncbi:hypothetical protein ASE75_01955 [Sphingomonas sp. Leaf17]|uniref:NepR family anti-sigma factor n=1 Tax=Sphingomonas sp. Leaf17 TaxID=1735683 RepID=UPI0006F9AD44|nr:NepR family anti-sigma factor [Sphingomonas sp. Leaf17]KQM67706.1 hypothetical protein ASE75_01955 [Sphingomonas sp. Leaf17]